MNDPLPSLPIDVWAHVACFMSQDERVRSFWSLRHAMMLPNMNTLHETMMCFLERASMYDRQMYDRQNPPQWPVAPEWSYEDEVALCDMGFESDAVVQSLSQSNGNFNVALAQLITAPHS